MICLFSKVQGFENPLQKSSKNIKNHGKMIIEIVLLFGTEKNMIFYEIGIPKMHQKSQTMHKNAILSLNAAIFNFSFANLVFLCGFHVIVWCFLLQSLKGVSSTRISIICFLMTPCVLRSGPPLLKNSSRAWLYSAVLKLSNSKAGRLDSHGCGGLRVAVSI